MSASSKKKLRKELETARMTERQEKERKEAKKTKAQTAIFVIIMAAVLLTAVVVMIFNNVKSSGYFTKNTIAATTGEHELNTVEMSYFFNDAISSQYGKWAEEYGDYLSFYTSMWGLDLSKPLDEQKYDDEKTWSDFFVEQAMNAAKETYALYDKAMAEGLTLTEEQEKDVEATISEAAMYGSLYGYSNLSDYLVAMYGYGSSEASYREYQRVNAIAAAYYAAHADSLEYTADDVKAHNDKNPAAYNSYSFNAYCVYVEDYLSGGTTGEDNKVTYSDEEKEAARTAAEKVANDLAAAKTVIELDKMIGELEINKDKTVASDPYVDSMYTSLPASFQTWMTAEGRKIGDTGVIADRVIAEHEHEEGEEHSEDEGEITGYYVVIFNGVKFNNEPLANVRHLLVSFEGGTYDSETGKTTYSDENKAAAKAEAEKYLNEWKEGEATEATFIELVKKYTDDEASKENGGLYEDITPVSNYVPNFLNWAIDPDRKAGNVEIVETEYGYHIMYYVADDELTYREYMIRNDLKEADMEEWYKGIIDPVTITEGKLTYLPLDRSITG
jgi:hypothetical protein